jgi:hypothetical protein
LKTTINTGSLLEKQLSLLSDIEDGSDNVNNNSDENSTNPTETGEDTSSPVTIDIDLEVRDDEDGVSFSSVDELVNNVNPEYRSLVRDSIENGEIAFKC